jgi:hypothetical protein
MKLSVNVYVLAENVVRPDDAAETIRHETMEEEMDAAVKAILDKHGYIFIGASLSVRPATKEDTIRFTPRRSHMQADHNGKPWLCNTQYVSRRYLVQDPMAVTCRKCLALLKEMGWTHEAGWGKDPKPTA